MAKIFSSALGGDALMGLWYHFAIMFEALFILTTVDAGTRVGRFLLQAFLGQFWKPLADTRSYGANFLASGLLVAAWGYFLYQGVVDPQGGINSLWPLFGIANQLLAVVALCLATTVILKMARPRYALATLLPLAWLAAVTFTAGFQKIFDASPKIGFLAAARKLAADLAAGAVPAEKIALTHRLIFNQRLDAAVAAAFLLLVGGILVTSVLRWIGLAFGGAAKDLRETAPVWLEEEILAVERASGPFGWIWAVLLLSVAILRNLAGEGPAHAPVRSAHAGCRHGIEAPADPERPTGGPRVSADQALSPGAAWAEREERRFARPRCC
jgi:carbon starvation protein CstA